MFTATSAARRGVERAKEILKAVGLEPERLEMYFLSGGMGATFAEIATQMTEPPASALTRSSHLRRRLAAEVGSPLSASVELRPAGRNCVSLTVRRSVC